jgi:hypothetical protein
MTGMDHRRAQVFAAAAGVALAGCSPTLDWRDVHPGDSGIQLLFPCKPAAQERRLALAGRELTLALWSCAADGHTWGLAHADVGEPAQVAPALDALARAAAVNVGAASTAARTEPPRSGASKLAMSRVKLQGALPDGHSVQMEVALFSHGSHVFQASVIADRLGDESVETFLGSISLVR